MCFVFNQFFESFILFLVKMRLVADSLKFRGQPTSSRFIFHRNRLSNLFLAIKRPSKESDFNDRLEFLIYPA